MRERKFIRKCPDGCGKDEYDLGEYRGEDLGCPEMGENPIDYNSEEDCY